MKLSTKISLAVAAVLVPAALTSVVALISAREITMLLSGVVNNNVPSVRAAEELEIALLNQRGVLAAYILDGGNPAWLARLDERKRALPGWFARARETAHTAEERGILDQLQSVYHEYDAKRERVLALYGAGDVGEAKALLLGDVIALHDRAYKLCEALVAANERYIAENAARSRREMSSTTVRVFAAVAVTIAFGVLLLWFFFHGLLRPLRAMAEDVRAFSGADRTGATGGTGQDELRKIGASLQWLMTDVRETKSRLEESRLQLLDSEKLASLGKLAASVGHEIRNPLTSVKMRVYSIRRALGDDPEYEDDLTVISEEIARLEEILRNFLEFSRPPQLNLRAHEVSRVLDKSLELCRHWFTEKDVRLTRTDDPDLPLVLADSEQLKQVFLNLLRNAVEAAPEGGKVCLSASSGSGSGGRLMAVVRIRDNGPGIEPEARERIFEPFFTTKEDGTGLGLCIVASILARHGGRLELEPCKERGACFAVWIPAYEDGDGHDSDRG